MRLAREREMAENIERETFKLKLELLEKDRQIESLKKIRQEQERGKASISPAKIV